MIVTFLDMDNSSSELNGAVVRDSNRLRQILQTAQHRWPFFCQLNGENGYCLLIGVGKVGCVQYSRTDGSPPYLTTVATGEQAMEDGYEEFVAAGTATQVEKRYCMPFDDIIKIAIYFMETGATCPFFTWEPIS
jgi:hypothetical protein